MPSGRRSSTRQVGKPTSVRKALLHSIGAKSQQLALSVWAESKSTTPVVRIESVRLRYALQNDVNAMIDSTKSKQREDAAGIRQVQLKYSRGTHRALTGTEDAAGIRQVCVLTGYSRGTHVVLTGTRDAAGIRQVSVFTGHSRGTHVVLKGTGRSSVLQRWTSRPRRWTVGRCTAMR